MNSETRRGFTLIEMVVVISMLSVLILLIAATLWGAVKVERADSAMFHRMTVQAQLADQFREDVGRATDLPESLGDLVASSTCLILKMSTDAHVVYRWKNDRLDRVQIKGTEESFLVLPVGGEHVAVEFDRSNRAKHLVAMRLIESRGPAASHRDWPVEISAALGGDNR